MRVLVVDQDSSLLTAITRTLGEYFTIDAVTTKADCLDLVRLNEFEVIVAGERLEDGSGLELLGSLARSRPDMLRIFAAERERLKLLKGRLGPFGLFRTLSYPIEPRQLLAALSAAAGIEEEVEETTEAQESAPPPAPEPAAPEPAARRAVPATGPSRAQAQAAAVATRYPRAQPPAAASESTVSRAQPQGASVATPSRPQPQTFAFAPAPSRAQTSASAASTNASRAQVSAAAPAPSRAQTSASATSSNASRAQVSPTPGQKARGGRPAAGASAAAASRQPARQPTPAALAAASKLDIVTRPKGFPPAGEASPARSAFVVGAGVILVLGGLALSFKIFNTKDEPVKIATNATAMRGPHFPPEVVKLVADTEVAFQQDDFKTARTDVAALQQIAPDHPRLPFFESLLKRLEATTQGSKRMFSRHTSAPIASSGASSSEAQSTSGTSAAQSASRASGTSRASSTQQSDTQRRQPDTDRDVASAEAVTPATSMTTALSSAKGSTPSAPTRTAATNGATFSGRTLEDTSVTTQTLATPSQATTTPIPRRPGSAAAPSDTQEPRLIQRVAADYPPEAARNGIEGSVDVSFTISTQGKVSDVTVVNAVPSDIFNRAAITAVRRWKYEPKTVNGVPVEAHQQLRVQFKLAQNGE
jgi:TonB family protein